MKKKILRISTYPTDIHNKVGFHSYKISNNILIDTIFFYPKINGSPLSISKNVKLDSLPKLPSFKKNKFLWAIGILFINMIILLKSFKYKFNIVHIHSILYLPSAIFFKIKGKKLVLSFHGEDYNYALNSNIFKYLVQFMDVITVISPIMKQGLSEIFKKDIFYIGNGIEKEVFFDMEIKRKEQIISVASFKDVKGHKFLIEGFSNFLKINPNSDLTLHLIGEGELRHKMETFVKKLDLERKIKFYGNLNSNDLAVFYNQSKYFILTSKREGFPKVLLEAMACNCMVISTKVGSVVSVLGKDYQLFIDQLTPEVIADKINLATKIKPFKLDALVKKYKWDNILKKYIAIYNSLNK